jgi:hypothetical protein
MGHSCGPKLSKTEYINMQSGKQCAKPKCSDIAKELENEFEHLEVEEIYIRIGQKLKEALKKWKELEEIRIRPPIL